MQCVVCISKAQCPERPNRSVHDGRASQATAPKHRSSRSGRVRFMVRVSIAAAPTTTLRILAE